MKNLILGTAGHIDHGKTALVKLLTGVDTDRLKEEKKRGITIELGFAGMDLPDGTHVGIVDVPGHEKFVRTMVSGAGGIDMVALVIAADESIMPQTREHFDICRLLQIQHGLVVITKMDLVDKEWRDLVAEDIALLVDGTFLEDAPVVMISAHTGEGKQDLISAIAQVASNVQEKKRSDIFRLPVDRVFTMKGFGTVITGSGVGGSVKVGDLVVLLPSNIKTKVRGLQVHNELVEEAGAGLRTAVNFQGLEKTQVARGEVLVKPGTLSPTYMVDVKLDLLPGVSKPLAFRTRIRFHHLAKEILGRVVPLSSDEIKPGQTAMAQLRLEMPAVVLPGDRFVLRSYSPMMTIGGGVVLHARPPKHKRPFTKALDDLKVFATGEISDRVRLIFDNAGFSGLPFSEIPALLGQTEKELVGVYRDLLTNGLLVRYDADEDQAVSGEIFDQLCRSILDFLETFHLDNPTLEGITRKELADKIEYGLSIKLVTKALAKLEKNGEIKKSGDVIGLENHKAALSSGQMEKIGQSVLKGISDGGTTPPIINELFEIAGGDKKLTQQILDLLANDGRIVRVSENLYYEKGALDGLIEKVKTHLESEGEMDAQAFKTLSGTTRKYAIPLLEFFDVQKITLRVGDKRIARKTN